MVFRRGMPFALPRFGFRLHPKPVGHDVRRRICTHDRAFVVTGPARSGHILSRIVCPDCFSRSDWWPSEAQAWTDLRLHASERERHGQPVLIRYVYAERPPEPRLPDPVGLMNWLPDRTPAPLYHRRPAPRGEGS